MRRPTWDGVGQKLAGATRTGKTIHDPVACKFAKCNAQRRVKAMIWGSCSLEAEARAQVMRVAAEVVAIMVTDVQ